VAHDVWAPHSVGASGALAWRRRADADIHLLDGGVGDAAFMDDAVTVNGVTTLTREERGARLRRAR
jgi:hypothetical protein